MVEATTQVTIDPEFQALIPPLAPDERGQLKRNLERDGCLDPLKVWNGVLLDGHNRLEICDELGIECSVQEVPEIRSRAHAKIWILKNQLGRRNLNESQRGMLAVGLKNLYSAEAKERQGTRTDIPANLPEGYEPGEARDKAAIDMNVSARTVQSAEKVVTDGTPELQQAVLLGDVSVSAAAEVAKLPEEEQRATVAEGPTAVRERARDLKAHFSSATGEWYTPPEIVHLVAEVLGQIDLDPASNPGDPNIPARQHYTVEDDGLRQPWSGRVFLNPPYGSEIPRWVERLCEHHNSGAVPEAIALLPARTDTVWFQRLAPYPRCFIKGRVKFVGAKSSAPFPSMLVYLGPRVDVFRRRFEHLGDTYKLLATERAA